MLWLVLFLVDPRLSLRDWMHLIAAIHLKVLHADSGTAFSRDCALGEISST